MEAYDHVHQIQNECLTSSLGAEGTKIQDVYYTFPQQTLHFSYLKIGIDYTKELLVSYWLCVCICCGNDSAVNSNYWFSMQSISTFCQPFSQFRLNRTHLVSWSPLHQKSLLTTPSVTDGHGPLGPHTNY